MPKSLEELKIMENKLNFPNRISKQEDTEPIIKEEIKSEAKPAVKGKICKRCKEDKPLTDFHRWATRCKDCAKIENKIRMEKYADKLYPNVQKYLAKTDKITINYVHKRTGWVKSVTSQTLNILVERGVLDVLFKNNRNYYSLPKPKEKESQYSSLTEVMDAHKPRNGLSEVLDKGVLKSSIPENEDTIEVEPKIEVKSIGHKELQEMINKTRAKLELIEPTPQQRILDIVDLSYKDAESIQITPETNEITIKMK